MSQNNGGGGFGGGWILLLLIGAGAWFFFIQPNMHNDAIKKVLEADRSLHSSISAEAGLKDVAWDQSGITSRYVQALRAIDLSGCPEDFRDAFKAHIQAWAGYEKVARSYGGFRGFFKGFFTGGGSAVAAVSEGADAQAEIESTWREVERIARKHRDAVR